MMTQLQSIDNVSVTVLKFNIGIKISSIDYSFRIKAPVRTGSAGWPLSWLVCCDTSQLQWSTNNGADPTKTPATKVQLDGADQKTPQRKPHIRVGSFGVMYELVLTASPGCQPRRHIMVSSSDPMIYCLPDKISVIQIRSEIVRV